MELISGFNEYQLDDLRSRLVGTKVRASELSPEIIEHTLDNMEDGPDDKLEYPRPYDINQVIHDLAGFCRVCSVCGYITDTNCLGAEDICECCSRDDCPECGEFHCICAEDGTLYGFSDDDFKDDDFEDEMDDFEGDDWEDDFEKNE